MRKENKLPAKKYSVSYELEYGNAVIEIHQDSIDKGEKILIIDDLVATGGTAEAAGKLVQKSNGTVAGFIFVINLFDLAFIYIAHFRYFDISHSFCCLISTHNRKAR